MTSQQGTSPVKKPRGRPKTLRRLGVMRKPIFIKPRFQSEDIYGSRVPDTTAPTWSITSPAFQLDLSPARSHSSDSPSVSSQKETAVKLALMRRSRRRPWDVRIDRHRELIRPFCVMRNDSFRPDGWVKFPRVLLSSVLERSYISVQRLHEINGTYEPCKMWEYQTHFGPLKALGFAHITVTPDQHLGDVPFQITVLVLEDPPLPGGVDFIIGNLDLTAVYNGQWNNNWTAHQYVLHNNNTKIGHDTPLENEILQRWNYEGPLCPPSSYFIHMM